jgi:hypothetical protein
MVPVVCICLLAAAGAYLGICGFVFAEDLAAIQEARENPSPTPKPIMIGNVPFADERSAHVYAMELSANRLAPWEKSLPDLVVMIAAAIGLGLLGGVLNIVANKKRFRSCIDDSAMIVIVPLRGGVLGIPVIMILYWIPTHAGIWTEQRLPMHGALIACLLAGCFSSVAFEWLRSKAMMVFGHAGGSR